MDMTPRRRTAVFLNLILTCIVLAIVSSATATALQPLMVDLHVDAARASWVTGGYTLMLAVAMPLTAWLVTRFKTRPLYITAVALYLATLVGCATAPNFAMLMAARLLGACANALVASMTQVSILSIFPKERRGSAMGWFGLSQGAAVVVGPTVGGLVIDAFGWRGLFWFAAMLCAVSLVWAILAMRVELARTPGGFDVRSFAMSTLAFGGVTLGLGNAASMGLTSPFVWVPLTVGVVSAAFFCRRQLRSDRPFLKIQLMRSKVFAVGVVLSMALYMAMMGSTAVLPLYVQAVAGQGALASGLVVMPGALAMALVSPVAGKAYDRRGIAPLAAASGVALVVGNAAMAFVGPDTPLWVASCLNVVRCLAIGLIQTPLVTWANSVVCEADLPHASALLTSLRNVAGSLGVSVFVGVMASGGGAAGVGLAYAGMALVSLPILAAGAYLLVSGRK